MAKYRLEPTPDTVADVFNRDRPPVLTVSPGDTVVVRSLDASGHLARQQSPGDRQQPTMFSAARGHCLTGPIAVRGARPGMVLSVHFISLRPDNWGWTVAGARSNRLTRRLGVVEGQPSWLLWDLDIEQGIGTSNLGYAVALAPFLGVVGLPPEESGEHSTNPPRAKGGGNIDCRELRAGSTLYLPVTVPDALLYVGDGHAAQGDGEVAGTAIECAMTTEITVNLVSDPPVAGIHAVTPTAKITFGFGTDLNEAMGDALDAMLTWMQSLYDLDRTAVLALASPAVNLRITQVANDAWGVHAVLPDGALSAAAGT